MLCNTIGLSSETFKKMLFIFCNVIFIIGDFKLNKVTKSVLTAKSCVFEFCAFYICILIAFMVLLQIPSECAALIMPVLPEKSTSPTTSIERNLHERKFGERLFPLQRNKILNDNAKIGTVNNSLLKSNKENYQGNSESEHLRQSPLTNEIFSIAEKYESLLAPSSASHPSNSDKKYVTVKKSQLVNVSEADSFGMSTEYFFVPSHSKPKLTSSLVDLSAVISSSAPILRIKPQNDIYQSTIKRFEKIQGSHGDHNHKVVKKINPMNNDSSFRQEPWVVPVIILASLNILMMVIFEVFLLFKTWRTLPSQRQLFLGQTLLLGLFFCSGLAAIITAQPSFFSCAILRFGVGVAYALVFASLLVKCVFLISLNGGVYLPAPYQGLLLLFAVLIQVAIGTQWLITQPPEVYSLHIPVTFNEVESAVGARKSTSNRSSLEANSVISPNKNDSKIDLSFMQEKLNNFSDNSNRSKIVTTVPLCKSRFMHLLFSLSYVLCLIIFVAVLAAKSRTIRDNYREATYIGLAIGSSIPIWIGWMLCGLIVTEEHKNACVAFGLVATSISVFLVMFLPKSRQLSAMGKEGRFIQDREEQFSSLSHAGSGYSPSFFHFKPIKYGIMNDGCGVSSAEVTLDNANDSETIKEVRNKHINSNEG